MTTTPNCESEKLLNFWKKESVPETRHLTFDQRRCEQHLDNTTRHNEDGLFAVQTPFKDGPQYFQNESNEEFHSS